MLEKPVVLRILCPDGFSLRSTRFCFAGVLLPVGAYDLRIPGIVAAVLLLAGSEIFGISDVQQASIGSVVPVYEPVRSRLPPPPVARVSREPLNRVMHTYLRHAHFSRDIILTCARQMHLQDLCITFAAQAGRPSVSGDSGHAYDPTRTPGSPDQL